MTNRKQDSIRFTEFLQALQGIQDMMKNENMFRVSNSPDEEWDLIESLEITPSKFVLKSVTTIIEFDSNLKVAGRIKKRKKRK